VLFHLVLVPLVAIGDESAWSAIYDLSTIPGLSWAAAVGHGFLLLQLWRLWSRRIRWDVRAIRWDRDGRIRELEAALRRHPGDVDDRLQLATIWTGLGHLRRARWILDGLTSDGATEQLVVVTMEPILSRGQGGHGAQVQHRPWLHLVAGHTYNAPVAAPIVNAKVSHRGQTSLPADLRHRWGIEEGGEIGFIDLGDAALVVPGGLAVARAELHRVLADRYESGLAALDDPDLADQ